MAKFIIFQDNIGHYRFVLNDKDGEPITTSLPYETKEDLVDIINFIIENASSAVIADITTS